MLTLYIDADACPVREEAFDVGLRRGWAIIVVTCGNIRVPRDPRIRLILVEAGADAVDDWIVAQIGSGDIAVTSDVLLAQRCLKQGAQVLAPQGRVFTAANIGDAVAARALSQHLRELGGGGGGPKPLEPRDRSAFRQALDRLMTIKTG